MLGKIIHVYRIHRVRRFLKKYRHINPKKHYGRRIHIVVKYNDDVYEWSISAVAIKRVIVSARKNKIKNHIKHVLGEKAEVCVVVDAVYYGKQVKLMQREEQR